MNRNDFYRQHVSRAATHLNLPLTVRQTQDLADQLSTQIEAARRNVTLTATSLSPQTAAVLQAIAAGETSLETARRMCLSEDTIKTHKRRLYRRLGAKTGAQAVFKALSQGLLAPAGGWARPADTARADALNSPPTNSKGGA
ncbi:response regulator transcription factor [Streptomyces sp. Je 1-369]|uniref:response regulator transcription factor n=1 Tax=Streptomyces sp. Je 1-369 TaxID=2966192 RepID=UPI002285D8E5|nr:LuxR C-terminal-related transcriptional regulator [Streptomyces sp. Je 1-369]WAL93930.1 LuxR C-terminal-related transcriptional regulator [Streptomyces sp. Je 1-369]